MADAIALRVRPLGSADLPAVAQIDVLHTGVDARAGWRRIFAAFVGRRARSHAIALGVDGEPGLVGYLFGEVRAVEFGSAACGWGFGGGVAPGPQRPGIASALL